MPIVSVVIPAFNSEAYIERAMLSARQQSLADIEIIVVDDASTDATVEVVRRQVRTDSRIVLLQLDRNGGPGIARNEGFSRAKGDWIAVLDADDAYLPERLERLISLGAEVGAHVISDNLLLRREGVEAGDWPMFTPEQLPGNSIMTASRFVEGNIVDRNHQRVSYGFMKPVVRRDFIRQHSLQYDAGRFSEDYLLALRYLVHGAKWTVAPEAYYVYTIRQHSLTAKFAVEELHRLAAAEDRLLEDAHLAGNDRLAAAIRKHLRSVRNAATWQGFVEAIKEKRPDRAVTELLASPAGFAHVCRETLLALPKLVARLRSPPR